MLLFFMSIGFIIGCVVAMFVMTFARNENRKKKTKQFIIEYYEKSKELQQGFERREEEDDQNLLRTRNDQFN